MEKSYNETLRSKWNVATAYGKNLRGGVSAQTKQYIKDLITETMGAVQNNLISTDQYKEYGQTAKQLAGTITSGTKMQPNASLGMELLKFASKTGAGNDEWLFETLSSAGLAYAQKISDRLIAVREEK